LSPSFGLEQFVLEQLSAKAADLLILPGSTFPPPAKIKAFISRNASLKTPENLFIINSLFY